MSYILDALLKAERERGIEQVPSLSTIHDTHEKPRKRSWIVTAGVIIILVIGLGFLLHIWNSGDRPVAETPDYAEQQQDTGITEHDSAAIAGSTESHSTTDRASLTRSIASKDLPVGKPETDRMAPAISSTSKAAADTSQIADKEIQSSPLQNLTIPQEVTPMAEEPITAGDTHQASSSPTIDNELPDSSPSPSDIAAKTLVLREAMQNMSISILLYADNPTDRLVFINGRKYVEGDYFNRLYLVEHINQDGVVLYYEGAQAVLKPAKN